jgi:FRG domain
MALQSVRKKPSKAAWPIWRIEEMSDFTTFLEEECDDDYVLFRGQREDWPLLPKIARVRPRSNLLTDERRMTEAFRREGAAHFSSALANDWDLLAIAQHHGMATRLLDWTKNPLAALWFAIRTPAEHRTRDAVIWVYCPTDDDLVKDFEDNSPFTGSRTRVFEPRHITPRIKAQDAVFTAHKYLTTKHRFVPLERNAAQRGKLQKVVIAPRQFNELRYQLDRCGIHDASLFPDLDGLAKRVEWSHTLYTDEKN